MAKKVTPKGKKVSKGPGKGQVPMMGKTHDHMMPGMPMMPKKGMMK